MATEIIIAIATAAVALVTSIASIVHNRIQQKKDRVQKTVLENRVKYLVEIREGYSSIIGLSNIKTIRLAKNSPEVMEKFSEMLFTGYGKIKAHIKPFYEIDKELLISLDRLYDCILSALNGDEHEAGSLDELRESFSDLYLKYDWAYWKYIQSQRDGIFVDSDDAFDKIYYDFVEGIEKNQKEMRIAWIPGMQ